MEALDNNPPKSRRRRKGPKRHSAAKDQGCKTCNRLTGAEWRNARPKKCSGRVGFGSEIAVSGAAPSFVDQLQPLAAVASRICRYFLFSVARSVRLNSRWPTS